MKVMCKITEAKRLKKKLAVKYKLGKIINKLVRENGVKKY